MKFDPDDVTSILEDVGQAVLIGVTTVYGKFKSTGKIIELYNGSVSTSGPLLLVSETSGALVTENSTAITIEGTVYQATQKLHDGAGFVELELTKDF